MPSLPYIPQLFCFPAELTGVTIVASGSHPLGLRAQRTEKGSIPPPTLPTKCSHTAGPPSLRCHRQSGQCQAGLASEQIGKYWSLGHVGKPRLPCSSLLFSKRKCRTPKWLPGGCLPLAAPSSSSPRGRWRCLYVCVHMHIDLRVYI